MKMRVLIFAAASLLPFSAAQAQAPMDLAMVTGVCQAASAVTDGAGTKPYICDNAILAFFDNANSHVMIQFTKKNDENVPLFAFAGTMAQDGVTLNVERISLVPGKPQPAQQASCNLSFAPPPAGSDRPSISGIECKGEVVQDAQKTTLSILFKPDPGQ